jgi:uncharacterized protein YjiS (DUF1127 family)
MIERLFDLAVRRFRRWRTQRLLAELTTHQLRDIGLSPHDVRAWSERLRRQLRHDSDGEKRKCALRGLAADQLGGPSEAGLHARREAPAHRR